MILAFFGIGAAAFWTWVFWTAVTVGISYAVSQLLQKDPKTPTVAPDELSTPTVREGTKYSIVFGTCWVENPVCAWWGDISAVAIRDHYTVNKWGNNKRVYYTVGYNYYIGMLLVVTQGQNDGIKQVKFADTLAWPDPTDPTNYYADGVVNIIINEPNLFGGPKRGGGVQGSIHIDTGASSQSLNTYLTAQMGANVSANRGLTTATLPHTLIGESPYLRPPKFLVKRTTILTDGTAQWYPAKATINTLDLNAAHILHECYTNTEWGFGITTLNDTAWTAAADTLYTENFGLSMKWEDQTQSLGDFVNDVLRHINGVIYQHPQTGEIELKLIRDDYTAAALTIYDDSDVIEVTDDTVGAIFESPNMLQFQYWNRQPNKPLQIPEYNLALMLQQGSKIIPYEVSFNGINDDTLARIVSAREREQMSLFPFRLTVKGKRTMSALLPGDVFKLTWPPLAMSSIILRVFSVNYGTVQEGAVTLKCIQDIFSVPTAAVFAEADDTQWADPRNDPAAAPDRLLIEMPFWDIYLNDGLSAALALDVDSGYLMVAASMPTSDAIYYELMLRDSPSGTFYADGQGSFTPNGTMDIDLPLNAVDVTINLVDAEGLSAVLVGDYAVIDSEILKVLAIDSVNDQVTLARGCLDTVPAAHNGPDSGGAGARVWFIGSVAYAANHEYTATDQPGVKILPATASGQLADDTAYDASAFNSRMNRPYPPGDFKIDGVSYPTYFFSQPTISWAHRDRTQQISGITEHSDASVGPEAGVTYTVEIYNQSDTLIHTETGLTGTSYTYTEAEERSDDPTVGSGGALNSTLRIKLWSVRSGYASWQAYDVTVTRQTSFGASEADVAITATGALSVAYSVAGQANVAVAVAGGLVWAISGQSNVVISAVGDIP